MKQLNVYPAQTLNEESKNIFDLSLSLLISGMTKTVIKPIISEKKYDSYFASIFDTQHNTEITQ